MMMYSSRVLVLIESLSLSGLPKAARISHVKAVMCMAFLRMCGACSDDKVYLTLPLYHMSASLLGIGGCIHLGMIRWWSHCPDLKLLHERSCSRTFPSIPNCCNILLVCSERCVED